MASISDERGWTRGARAAASLRSRPEGRPGRSGAAGSGQHPDGPTAPEVSPAPSLGVGVRSGPYTWATVRGTLGSRCFLDLKQSRALFSVTEALGAFCVAEPVAAKARGDPRNLTPRSWTQANVLCCTLKAARRLSKLWVQFHQGGFCYLLFITWETKTRGSFGLLFTLVLFWNRFIHL